MVGLRPSGSQGGLTAGKPLHDNHSRHVLEMVHVWMGEADGDQFGFSVAIVKDGDGDGLDDALIGAPFHDGPGGEDAGRVYLFSGGSGVLLRLWDGETPLAHFGHAVATLGDRTAMAPPTS